MDKRKFLTGCMCCMSMIALTACSKRNKINNEDLFPGETSIEHIEIHLVEHCNLNCKYCSHFSCIAEKEIYNVEKYEQDMAQLAKVTGSKIASLQLLGGEPLLHPEIEKIFDISRKYFPKTNIDILTNGLLLNSVPKSFWKSMHKNNIFLCPSIYPVDINWESIFKKAEKFGVNIVMVTKKGLHEEIKFENIDEYRMNHFYKLNLDLKGRQKWEKNKCPFVPHCANYFDGKIYPCFVISNIRHFNKKFGKKLPVTPQDYIDIYKVTSIEEIKNFLNNMSVPFCKYCGRVTPNLSWQNSPQHSISEWVST